MQTQTAIMKKRSQPEEEKPSPFVERMMRASAVSISLLILATSWFAFYSETRWQVAFIAAVSYSVVTLIGVAFSDNFLNALILSIPTLFTSKGRVVLISVALSLLSREVIKNVQINTEQIVRTSECVKEFGMNTSLVR